MTLNEWKDREGLSFADMEKKSGITSSKLKRIANSGTCVRLADAQRIVKMTMAEVDFADLMTGDC